MYNTLGVHLVSVQKPPKNAILLGEGKWIEHVDLTGRYESAVNIDLLVHGLESMWAALETECVAECCGLDAFDFSPESIKEAASKLDLRDTCVKLDSLQAQLSLLGADVLVSKRLNNYCDRIEFNALLDHLRSRFAAESQQDA